MKKLLIIILALCILLAFGNCGKKKEKKPGTTEKEKTAKTEKKSKDGGKKKKGEGKLDIDKLDIPDRMKQAIKAGRIPMARVKQILERRKGGGDAPNVKITRVMKKQMNSSLVLNGVVEPEKKVEVYSRLTAYVKKLVAEEGDYVKQGDLLALLDDTEIIISYQQAKIQLDQAKLSLDEAKKNYKRYIELRKTELISEQEFQVTELTFKNTKLEYSNKNENYKNLQLQLNYTKIKSPVAGYVTERLIEVGSKVNANQQVFLVEDFSPLLIKLYIPTSDVINLKKGMPVELNSDILTGHLFVGNIKLINPRIDVQSGTVKVTVEVFDKTSKLKPGMFVEAKIIISQKDNALVIPQKSISYKDNKAFVFVFGRGQVTKREISPGISDGDMIEITSGLKEGDNVVTVGIETLKDKMRVKVIR